MNKRIFRAGLVACLLSAASTLALSPAVAADSGVKVSPAVGKLLGPAQKLLQAKDYAGALALIKQAQAVPDQTPTDTYEINDFLANAALGLADYATADAAYETMAESAAMPEEAKANTLHNATLLAVQSKHFDKAVKYGEAYIALGGSPDPSVVSALAQAYYVTGDFAKSQATAQKALDAQPPGAVPNDGALQIVLQSQLKAHDYTNAAVTLAKIVTYRDMKDEWGDLIDLSISTKGMKDITALHIYRLRLATKATGHAEDFTTGASLALSQGYPVEAESFLNAGISAGVLSASGPTGTQLANVRDRAAKDRAVITSFAAIANKAATGELDVKLAETYFGYGRYADAETAAREAITKGGPKTDANEATMVLGEALAMEGKNADAVTAFNAVQNPTPGWVSAQHIWLVYANRKYTGATP